MVDDNRYAVAGWAAILSAAGTLAMLGLSFMFDFAGIAERRGGFTPPSWSLGQVALVASVDAVAWALGIYALIRFRDLLRERYDFHALDHLIWIVIGAGLLIPVVSYAHRLLARPEEGVAGLLSGALSTAVLAVLNGVIGIVFATRLLRLNGSLNGYKKPLAYTYLAGSICFLLVLPSLIGVVLLAAWSILLGLAFFRGEELEELEVV